MAIALDLINVKRLLETERVKRFMTYEDIGKGVGCSASYIFRIEKGVRKKPSYDIVSKIITFFNLTDKELSTYIDGELDQEEVIKQDILSFISDMNCDNFGEVSHLLEYIKNYQKTLAEKELKKDNQIDNNDTDTGLTLVK